MKAIYIYTPTHHHVNGATCTWRWLTAKNGILIVEFTNQLLDEDVNFYKAIIQASSVCFRPIVMTGLTTVAGAVPLIITSGAGAETRQSISTVVLFGVLSATFFTVFLVPAAYSLIAKGTKSPNWVSNRLNDELTEEGPGKTSNI